MLVGGREFFRYTNENLEAIVECLEVKDSDRVLAVCGSGDQALALLEKAKEVVAIDISDQQLAYAMIRVGFLKVGNRHNFFNVSIEDLKKIIPLSEDDLLSLERDGGWETYTKEYFNPERLARIEKKLDRITFLKADIYLIGDSLGKFNKVYLSNAYAFLRNYSGLTDMLNEGALIYATTKISERAHPNLKIHRVLSEKLASFSEPFQWSPKIYHLA